MLIDSAITVIKQSFLLMALKAVISRAIFKILFKTQSESVLWP
jgi:hypothetical protein